MADDMISKIGWLYTGQQEIQRYLADLSKVATQTQALEKLGTVRGSAFEGLSKNSVSVSSMNDLLSTSVRTYDTLLQKVAELRRAELARSQAERQLNARGKNYMPDPVAREQLDLKSRIAVNAASERLAKAYLKAQQEVEKEAQAAARRAVLGSGSDSLFKADGTLDFPTRNDSRSLQPTVDTALKQARNEAAITQKRIEDDDLAAAKERGKQYNIQVKRDQQESLDRANELGKQYTIQVKRNQQEDLDNAKELGKQWVIQKKRSQTEDINRANELGKQFTIQQKREQQEDLDNAKELGKQYRITKLRGQQEDIAAYNERARLAENERQRAIYEQTKTTPFPNAAPTTDIGKAQTLVNAAAARLANAQQARADLDQKGVVTAKQLLASDETLRSASAALASARNRLAGAEARAATTTTSGLRSDFVRGFRGASDRPFAEQIGQAFKFSVFYGTAYKALFGLTQTLQQTLQEGIAFESAMTELKIASGQSADAASDLAKNLGQQATLTGAAPSLGIQLGAQSLGLFGATEASGVSQAEQDRIATISARTALGMSLGSKTDPALLQTQIAAVANAFGTGYSGQIQVADLDAYLGRRFGVQPGETVQAVAESGTLGQAAGFSMEEVFAINAALQSRTGQSSSTVAGWASQIFSRGGEGSLTALLGKYNIDPTTDLATQIKALSDVYKTASDNERATIAAGFGRGKVQGASVVLLDELPTILKEAAAAETKSTGEADRIRELRLKDIGGQIQLTIAVLKDFASALGQSGLLQAFGAGIVVIRELVEAATGLIRMWNSLSGTTRGVIAAIVALGIAGRAAASSTLLWNAAARASAARAGGAGVLGAAGAGVGGAAAVVGAVAGLYAISELYTSSKNLREAQKGATEALNMLATDNDPNSLRSRAGELQTSANMAREGTGSWINSVIPALGRQDDKVNADADALEQRARELNRLAKVAESQQTTAATPLIRGFDTGSLRESLDAITASGGTAEDRFRALADAVTKSGDAAASSAKSFDVSAFADLNSESLVGILGENIAGIDGKPMDASTVREALKGFSGGTPANIIEGILRSSGVSDIKSFDNDAATKAAKALVERTNDDADFKGTDEYKAAVAAVRDFLLGQVRNARILVDETIKLTPAEATNGINALVQEAQAAAGNLQDTDYAGKVRNARQLVRGITTYNRQTDGAPTNAAVEQLAAARRALAQSQFDEMENLRRAAQRNAKNRAEVAKVGQRFLRRELNAAIKGGNQDLLAEIIGQAGGGAVGIARAIIQEAINAARQARKTFLQILAVRREAQSVLGAEVEFVRGGLGKAAQNDPQLANLQGMLDNLPTMQSAGSAEDDVYTSGSDVPGYKPPEKGKSAEDKKAEREQARQEMLDLRNNLYLLSIDLSDPLAQATAAVKDARRRLQSDIASGQSKGTIAADRVTLRQAEIEREATAFQQRLQAVQTAEELGRVSHRKYINYLESEHRRLSQIKDRTYQQQQQLDEIDRLMKDAADAMQGQWNFGDIKLPTPYQVRRQVEQMRLDAAGPLNAVSARAAANNVTTINIDGADTGKVRQIIKETIGSSNATVTNRPRHR